MMGASVRGQGKGGGGDQKRTLVPFTIGGGEIRHAKHSRAQAYPPPIHTTLPARTFSPCTYIRTRFCPTAPPAHTRFPLRHTIPPKKAFHPHANTPAAGTTMMPDEDFLKDNPPVMPLSIVSPRRSTPASRPDGSTSVASTCDPTQSATAGKGIGGWGVGGVGSSARAQWEGWEAVRNGHPTKPPAPYPLPLATAIPNHSKRCKGPVQTPIAG